MKHEDQARPPFSRVCGPTDTPTHLRTGMRCVLLSNCYPRWELNSGDSTMAGLDELKLVDIRRLFSDRASEEDLEFELQREEEPETAITRNSRRWD